MDDPGAANTQGQQLWQYTCNGTNAQQWTLQASGSGFELINLASGLCLTESSATNLASVVQQTCQGSAGQVWTFSNIPAPAPVNGSCGSANGVAVSSAPSANLCSIGSSSSVTGSGPF